MKISKIHTLDSTRAQAREILARRGLSLAEMDATLKVCFETTESENRQPTASVSIYIESRYHFLANGYGSSPEAALVDFEEAIVRKFNLAPPMLAGEFEQ